MIVLVHLGPDFLNPSIIEVWIEYENEYFATVGDECCNRLQPAKYCVQILLRYDFFVDLQTYQLSSIQLQMLKLHYHFLSKEIAMSIFESERCVARLATSPSELIFHLVLHNGL